MFKSACPQTQGAKGVLRDTQNADLGVYQIFFFILVFSDFTKMLYTLGDVDHQ